MRQNSIGIFSIKKVKLRNATPIGECMIWKLLLERLGCLSKAEVGSWKNKGKNLSYGYPKLETPIPVRLLLCNLGEMGEHSKVYEYRC